MTVFHKDNKYKPLSTILEVDSMQYYNTHKAEVQRKALANIGHFRHLTPQELIKQGYTKIKTREYDLNKIQEQQELKHRINLIKYVEKQRQNKSKGL